jgi:hypothetical protein
MREETGFDVSASLIPLGVEYEIPSQLGGRSESDLCR